MVKADVRKDYYADLGLQPSAEAEDIKKQFRKLALKYHPDRNPGRETEFNAKFQLIQAANEILSDPKRRLDYDKDRLRAGYGKFYEPSSQRKPPPTSFTAPKPARYPFPSRPYPYMNGASAGANRYGAHARAGASQWQHSQDEEQTRADAFKGFHNMRTPNSRGSGPQSGGAPRQHNTPFGNQRPKSAYEKTYRENSKTQSPSSPNSAKKRYGFAPGAADGDEPPARNTSSYTNNRSERPSSMYFDPAPSPTARKPAAPEPPLPQEFERSSSRYARTGGEKTFFTSSGLGRSSTVRTPSGSYHTSSARTNPSSPNPSQPERHRSASPKTRRDRSYSFSSTSSDLDDEIEEEPPRPKAVPKSRLRPNQKFNGFYEQEDHDLGTGHNSDSAAFARGSYRPEQQTSTSKYVFLFPYRGCSSSYLFFRRTDASQNATGPQPAEFARRSSHSLHKKFSADDWREHLNTFDFLGAASKERTTFRRSPTTRDRSRTTTQADSAPPPSSSANPPGVSSFDTTSSDRPAPAPFAQAKFSADHWAAKLNNLSWDFSQTDKTQNAGNTPPSPKKHSRPATRIRSTPQPTKVTTEAEEAQATVDGKSTPTEPEQSAPLNPEPMDMDIDDEVSSMPRSTTSKSEYASAASGSRNTSYPDLFAHNAENTFANAQKSQPPSRTESNTASAETRNPLFDLENLRNTAPFTTTNNSGIENLKDVHATLPFESRAKQQTTTKRDIRPRSLDLPNPPKRPWAPTAVPIGPGSQQFYLPREKWNWYVSAMSTYMHEWNAFNRRMLLHFNTRQEAIQTGLAPGWISAVGDTGRLKMNGSGGDGDEDEDTSEIQDDIDPKASDESLVPGSAKGGFSAYLRGIEEDIQVRKHWEVACELHRECILDLGRLREWIRNGGKVA
ncbi:Heat shock protein DnaJ N-terminal [Penicillium macrosclerotiorum]|uniref:Heat shock protein DnaJ N-terminal n=1 Tax=Penicillium macrosclerotiorum TaxID=303699 RepID=UPI002548EE9A|nr:Heat shock protein DnaJ N-terminal [Penicillium macrosclerotiorum]KAJ5682769.1 Heat shock protein DnaJ N-terminal [Penicillium macrosclerotiorum]